MAIDEIDYLDETSFWYDSLEELGSWAKTSAIQFTALLSIPLSKSHECFRRIQIVDALNPTASKISNFARKLFLFFQLNLFILAALITTFPAIALRFIVCSLQADPFLYKKGQAEEITLMNRQFSLFSWNICCPPGGYAISDGGVLPWEFRIDSIIEQLKQKDADVICLNEVFDPNTAFYLTESLKDQYAHFYFVIGFRPLSISSGLFVASKFKIDNPRFTPFPKDMLIGRTKQSEKGLFAFDLQSNKKTFAHIYLTHLQHSEEPEFPTKEEIEAREQEMKLIMTNIKEDQRCILFTGDLNLDDKEYNRSFWKNRFIKKGDLQNKKTWLGDKFCVEQVVKGDKKSSGPLNLDYALLLKGAPDQEIHTSLTEPHFDPAQFLPEALSDHRGLYSIIKL